MWPLVATTRRHDDVGLPKPWESRPFLREAIDNLHWPECSGEGSRGRRCASSYKDFTPNGTMRPHRSSNARLALRWTFWNQEVLTSGGGGRARAANGPPLRL